MLRSVFPFSVPVDFTEARGKGGRDIRFGHDFVLPPEVPVHQPFVRQPVLRKPFPGNGAALVALIVTKGRNKEV